MFDSNYLIINNHFYRASHSPSILHVKAGRRKFWHLRSVADTLRFVVVLQMFLVYSPTSKEHHMVNKCFISFGYQRFYLNSLKYFIIIWTQIDWLFAS